MPHLVTIVPRLFPGLPQKLAPPLVQGLARFREAVWAVAVELYGFDIQPFS